MLSHFLTSRQTPGRLEQPDLSSLPPPRVRWGTWEGQVRKGKEIVLEKNPPEKGEAVGLGGSYERERERETPRELRRFSLALETVEQHPHIP